VSAAPGLKTALEALYSRVPLGMRLGLDPMRDACARAGHPELAFDVAHVGGTNGKGSTSAMVEATARAAGLRTGLYTSPHLVHFAERIRIDGQPIDDEALARILDDALRIGADLSFFETATLAAFLAFRAAGVGLAVVEVGIGGRLDATNVIARPKVTAITGVAFDHQDKLGDTLAAIAREKAAIAKPGVPLVLGRLAPEAERVAMDVATAAGARIVRSLDLPPSVYVGLAGPHQRDNARVAYTIGGELGFAEDVRARGISEVSWPGRLERITVSEGDLRGEWILDGAHNPDGAEALARALAGERVGALVFGALADKAWREMLSTLMSLRVPRVYTTPHGRAPVEPAVLAAFAEGAEAPSIRDALARARTAAAGAPVVVAGSLYLIGEARALLLGLEPDPIVSL
jgi:dihydrofolate synthase/folylpolyglutamate synthase